MSNLPIFKVQNSKDEKWTNEQLTAINLQGGRILVSAAAGSGKTAVLTERVIRLVKKGYDITRFLIVTFTVSAANEMRSRIRKALQEELNLQPNNRHIQRQALLVGRAKICTIDSFCGEIVRKNFQLANVSPDFRICSGADDELIKREALTRVFENAYAGNDQNFIKAVKIFSTSKNDEKFFALIYNLISWLYSLPYPKKAMEHFCKMWNPQGENKEMYNSPWYKVIASYSKGLIEGHINKYEYALNLMSSYEGFEKYSEIFESEKEMLSNILQSKTEEEFCEKLCLVYFKTLSAARGVDEKVKDAVKLIRDKCKADINKLRNETLSTTPEQYFSDLEEFHPVLCNISKIICEFFTIQEEIKNERNCLSFADVEGSALRLLIKDYNLENGKYEISPLAKEISNEFDFVMLDEYQDTNLLQNLIFESVSENGNKLFCVGDVKQSIYRFRRAMPQLFMNRLLSAKEAGEGFPAVVRLSKNFRSSQGVINFVNYFFGEMMSKQGAEIEYNKDHLLNLGANYPENDYETKVNIISSQKQESEDLAGEEDRKAYAQGKACAMEIKKLINSGRKIYDSKTGALRDIKLSDMVILMRSVKNRARGYVAALKDEGVEVYCDAAASFYDNYEVLFFTAFLEAVDNPYNDMSLAAALRSPMYNFSVQELTDIKENYEGICFYDRLLEASKDNEKASFAVLYLEKYRSLCENLPVYKLIWQIYSDFSLFDIVTALGNGEKRVNNLKRIYMQSRDYENSSLKGLYGFLRFLEKVREQGDDSENSQAAPSDDYVKITTIHKSKGLEYPIVFLCGLDVHFPMDDIHSRIIPHDSLGLGCTLRDFSDNTDYATLQREAIKIELKKELVAEEMRLLYVAMTRAKEKLYLMLYSEDDIEKRLLNIASEVVNTNKAPASFIEKCNCTMDWVLYALMKDKAFNPIKKQFDFHTPLSLNTGSFNVEIVNLSNLSGKSFFINSKQAIKNMDNLEDILEFEYNYPDLCYVPAKVSVSDLKGIRLQDEDGKPLFKEKFLLTEPQFDLQNLKATQKGTAFHRFMQFIDLYNKDMQAQAKALYEKGVFTKEEMLSLPYEGLNIFFNSSTAENMRKSPLVEREYRFLSDITASDYSENISHKENAPVLIQGVIDMFYENENKNLVLVDYKTDKADNEEYFKVNYSRQLQLYAKALEKITGKKVEKQVIYAVNLGKEVEV